MAQKVALITGITGQDGSYLVEFLLKKGYEKFMVSKGVHHSSTQIELITSIKIRMKKMLT